MSDQPIGTIGAWLNSVRVIILNWNLPVDTLACVNSLLAAGLPPQQILVVDNGSADNSLQQFDAAIPAVPILPLTQNVGFAGGNNRGIEWALADGADWILLLNNDTEVAPTFFAKIAQSLSDSQAKLISPLIFYHPDYADGQDDVIWSAGDVEIGRTLLTRPQYKNEHLSANLPAVLTVDFLTACALFVHRSVFAEIGQLDETFFMYGEDVDFCQRARLAGFELACATTAQVWHKVARSSGGGNPQQRIWQTEHQARFYRRYASRWQMPLLFSFTLLRSLRLATRDSWQGEWDRGWATLRGWWRGWWG